MKLESYLERIGFSGTPAVNVRTLAIIHRQHLISIPYENIDVQLGEPLDLDLERIFQKLVVNRRGGWCYEMNGLLEWALREIGFDVTRVNGGVMRAETGDDALGNHLVLLVNLEDTWVVDVGFGDGVIDPVPLRAGGITQRGFNYCLEQLDEGTWRFHNQQHGAAPSFDFCTSPADETLFHTKCEYLQTSPESQFVKNLVTFRFTQQGYEAQVGRLAKRITEQGVESWLVDSAEQLVERLETVFGLDVPQVATLWQRIMDRHDQLMREKPLTEGA
jgi:N-hydroxyarylamine O-acetyltransferase